jgi:hypothetical protein
VSERSSAHFWLKPKVYFEGTQEEGGGSPEHLID